MIDEEEPIKVRPLTTYYIPIKENLGFRFVVWPTSLSIEKVSKNLETTRWDRLQSLSLTRRAVEFIATRAGSMLEQWDVVAKGETPEARYYAPWNGPRTLSSHEPLDEPVKSEPKKSKKKKPIDATKIKVTWAKK